MYKKYINDRWIFQYENRGNEFVAQHRENITFRHTISNISLPESQTFKEDDNIFSRKSLKESEHFHVWKTI